MDFTHLPHFKHIELAKLTQLRFAISLSANAAPLDLMASHMASIEEIGYFHSEPANTVIDTKIE